MLEERKAEIAKEVELEAAGGQKKRKRANSEDGSDEELDVTIEYVFKPPRELEDIIQRAQQQATQNGHALVEGAGALLIFVLPLGLRSLLLKKNEREKKLGGNSLTHFSSVE